MKAVAGAIVFLAVVSAVVVWHVSNSHDYNACLNRNRTPGVTPLGGGGTNCKRAFP